MLGDGGSQLVQKVGTVRLPHWAFSCLSSLHVSCRVERREWSRLKAKVGGRGVSLVEKVGVFMELNP
jgi:hypothetical protein